MTKHLFEYENCFILMEMSTTSGSKHKGIPAGGESHSDLLRRWMKATKKKGEWIELELKNTETEYDSVFIRLDCVEAISYFYRNKEN